MPLCLPVTEATYRDQVTYIKGVVRTFSIILLGLCLLIISLNSGFHRDAPAPVAVTTSRLKNLAKAVGMCEEKFHQPILSLLNEKVSSESTIKLRLMKLLTENSEFLGVSPDFIQSSLFNDGWGNPLEVATTAEVLPLKQGDQRVLSRCGIIIWSKGKNKTNELGRGDDVVWPGIPDQTK